MTRGLGRKKITFDQKTRMKISSPIGIAASKRSPIYFRSTLLRVTFPFLSTFSKPKLTTIHTHSFRTFNHKMPSIEHPTIKGKTPNNWHSQVYHDRLRIYIDHLLSRWLVPRDLRHVAWPGYDPPCQGGSSPREEQIPGCPHLRVHRLRHRPRPRQRYPVHRA